MQTRSNPYRCRACGAFSYRKLTRRGPDGSMGYGEQYSCSGCGLTFIDPAHWRAEPEAVPSLADGLHAPVGTVSGDVQAPRSDAAFVGGG